MSQYPTTSPKNLTATKLAQISYYTDRSKKTGVDITMGEFLQSVPQKAEWKRQAEHVRNGPDKHTDKDEYDRRKGLAACVTISGTYDDDKAADSLREHSGFLAADFDELGDEVEATRDRINADPYTYASFVSIGGHGLCVLVKVQPERFADAFLSLEKYYLTTYGLIVDKQCKNVNRLRYVSYDPAAYHNEDAQIWRKYLPAKERKKQDKPVGEYVHTDDNIEYVLDQIEARGVDIVPGYDEWYRVGFALASKYGADGRDYFHRVSQWGSSYDHADCDKTYNYLLRYGARDITIATFYYFAKAAGVEVMSPQTREIVSVAVSSKRNRISIDSTIETVVKMLDVSAGQARFIIEQVFAARGEVETEQTIFEQAVTHIRTQHALFYNDVSRRIEKPNGAVVEGRREVNDLYNELLILFDGKLRRSQFESLLFSSTVPRVNLIHRYFTEHQDRQPTGVIARLAATIETDTGWEGGEFDPTYAEYFLRKWLISLVAIAYGELSDLMLILTGPQGSGKTEFFRRLLPHELRRYYDETKLDRGKDDEILMCEKWIVMLDELSGKTFQDVAAIKALLSKRFFTLRVPYGNSNETIQRRAALCGTSNPKAVLHDETGNRRVIPINVISIDRDAYNAIDKTDLLMEAYHAWKGREVYQLTKDDVARLNENTTGFEKWSFERTLLERYYAKPTGAGGELIESLQAVDIQLYLEQRANNRKLDPDKTKSALSAMGIASYQKRMGKDPVTRKQRRPYVYDVVKVEDA